jgi:hypothetical protein
MIETAVNPFVGHMHNYRRSKLLFFMKQRYDITKLKIAKVDILVMMRGGE